MKKYLKTTIFIITILAIILFIYPSFVLGVPAFNSIDINSLNFNSIDADKIDSLKSTLENLSTGNYSSANAFENVDKNAIKNKDVNAIDVNSVDMDEVAGVYKELSEVISNDDIANFIDDNKKALSEAGANEKLLSTSSTLLKTFDADAVIDIMQNDLDVNKILESYKNGESLESILIGIMKNTSTTAKIKIACKLLFSNDYFKLVFAFLVVVMVYSIIITGLIFKKVGKPSFATIIPIYRDIIHLKMCNFSPWLLILVFIPVIGWLALMAIAVVSRFELSRNFGHGFFFGLGLLILPIFFRTYLALSNDEYIGEAFNKNK